MLSRVVMAASATMLAICPAHAEPIPQFQEIAAQRTGAAVGAYLRLPFQRTAGRPARLQAGLRLSAIRHPSDSRGIPTEIRDTDVVDLRLAGLLQPTFLVAGRPLGDERNGRLNLGTGETIAIAGGGLLVLLVVAVSAGGGGLGDTCPTIGGSRDHCINP
jgi:hypothetical protein